VNASPADFALVSLLTVAFTSTLPAACAGDTTVHSVLVAQLTEVPAVVPNFKTVPVLPGPKPAPITVTLAPPAVDPLDGLTLETIARKLKRSLVTSALVPPGVVTVTSTVPTASAGANAVIVVDDTTVKLVAFVAPNVTDSAPIQLVPGLVTVVAPTSGAPDGDIEQLVRTGIR
jgi:hypothetical protein